VGSKQNPRKGGEGLEADGAKRCQKEAGNRLDMNKKSNKGKKNHIFEHEFGARTTQLGE
jgi:hypothetical protein